MLTLTESSHHILVVEDDEDTAEVVSALLQTAGYSTAAVDTGETALSEINHAPPDLVLLDISLPDMNGLEVLRQVRANSPLPLIVLSAFSQERDKVQALEAGADDYMSKPFSPEELVARVKALLRRVNHWPQPEPRIKVRSIEVDLAKRTAHLMDERLHLTPIEYGLLVALMRSAGRVVSHEDLLHAVWGDQYDGDYSVLRVNIARLRSKLQDNPRQPAYIVTVPGQGYTMPMRLQ